MIELLVPKDIFIGEMQHCKVSNRLEEQAFENWAGYAFRMAQCYLATAALYGYMLGAESLKAT